MTATARKAVEILVLDEAEPCTQGGCQADTVFAVAVGLRMEGDDVGEGEFPLCRVHVHDFIDFVLDKGSPE